MKKLFVICILLSTIQVYGQTFYTDLYGFRLGQYRHAARNELGNPFQYGMYEDGFAYEAFLLKPDTSLYIVFEYAAGDTNTIWSIQVSGVNPSMYIGFKNAKMSLDRSETEKLFGTPTSKKDIGVHGQEWIYDKTNLSLEVNTQGQLSSVKILDNSNELFPAPDLKRLPSFEKIQKALSSNNNEDILNLLTGDAEVYKDTGVYYFKKSFKTEQATDYSKMLSLIREISKNLSTVNVNNPGEYEENMRLVYGADIKHVIKIKKGHTIKEIVLKYYGGQYLIYEINMNAGQ